MRIFAVQLTQMQVQNTERGNQICGFENFEEILPCVKCFSVADVIFRYLPRKPGCMMKY